jgi:F0F1-type ATP synthase membrane subunit b/b'
VSWAIILSLLSRVVSALWKPIAAFFAARQIERSRDLARANEVRRRAQVARERVDADLDELGDDALDRRLRELRGEQSPD